MSSPPSAGAAPGPDAPSEARAGLAVELQDVWFSYHRRPVLEGIDLEVRQGDFLGIIGPNGGGKTTLLKLVLGLLKPDRGEVRVLGGSPEEARGRVGYVPQHAGFDRSFPISVREAVAMGRLGGNGSDGSGRGDGGSVERALERVELRGEAGTPVGRLSGGQLQRMLLARALATTPELLLLDEPTASVDTRIGATIYELLERLTGRMTVVLVSHDIGVISRHVRTVGCLNRRLHYHGREELTPEMLEDVYGAPVDMISHDAHRVLDRHEGSGGRGGG